MTGNIARLFLGTALSSATLVGAPALAQSSTDQALTNPSDGAGKTKDSAALAQDRPDTHARDELLDIVITAQKRAEKIIDVPVSITAFTAKQLAARNITDLAKLGQYTPSLEVTPSGGGGAGITLRGVTTGVGGVGVDPSVGVYVDGAYVARDYVGQQTYLDVERVEVLRGPQGTLYGRNTTGGAYNIYHKLPTADWRAGGKIQYGSSDFQHYDGYISGPILGDKVLFRAAIGRNSADEDGVNLVNGKRLRKTDSLQGVATLLIRPTDNLTLTLRGDVMRDNGTNGALMHVVRLGTANSTANVPSNPYEYRADFIKDGNYTRNRGINAEVEWDIGGYQIKSITAARRIKISTEYDTDYTELPISTAVLNDQSSMFTQEFQIVSPTGGRFDWVAGAYYYREKAHDLTTTGGPFPYGPFYVMTDDGQYLYSDAASSYLSLLLPFDSRGRFDSTNLTHSYSLYGQARYKLTDRLQATMGLRYTRENRNFDGSAGNTFVSPASGGVYGFDPSAACAKLVAARPVSTPAGVTAAQAQQDCLTTIQNSYSTNQSTSILNRSSQRLSFSNLSMRFVLDYHLNGRTHVFASATSGFKSGGFNSYDTDAAYSGSQPGNPGVPVISFQPPFGPEKLWSYEAGIKGEAFGRKLQYSIDGFFYKWQDIQSQIYNYTNRTSNITNDARARAGGIEVDLTSTPWKGGEIDFNGAWITSKYTHFGSTIDDVITGQTGINFTGTSLPGSPTWKFNFGIQQTATTKLGYVTLRGEYQHRDATVFVYSKDPIAKSGKYDLFNLRLTWQDPKARVWVSAYVENLFDSNYDYYRYGSSTAGVIAIVGRPRMVGVRLGFDF